MNTVVDRINAVKKQIASLQEEEKRLIRERDEYLCSNELSQRKFLLREKYGCVPLSRLPYILQLSSKSLDHYSPDGDKFSRCVGYDMLKGMYVSYDSRDGWPEEWSLKYIKKEEARQLTSLPF